MALRHNYRPRTDAAEEFMKGIREVQERVLAKEEAELAEEKAGLAKEKAGLAKEKAELAQETEKLKQSEARLAKEEAELATIKRFKPLSEQESAQFRDADQCVTHYTEQLKPRLLLVSAIKKDIQEYQGLEEQVLKKTKLAALKETLDAIEKARVEENALEQQYVDKMATWKDTLTQMKAWLDQLPEDRSPYTTQTKRYESGMIRFKRVEEGFEKAHTTQQRLDGACLKMKNNVSALAEQLQAESPDHSMGTPPSPVSSMQASSSTPPRAGSDSDQMAAASASASPSSDRSSGDVSPERRPKKGELDEKEMPMQNQFAGLSLQPKAAAPQLPPKVAQPAGSPVAAPQKPAALAPVPPKKGILSGLFGSKKPKAPVDAANPAAVAGQAFKKT